MARALIFGAGNIGRGFIGQLCCESGREAVFVDVDRELVDFLAAQGHYELLAVTSAGAERHDIGPVTAIDGRDQDAVRVALAGVDLAATAVGVRALEFVIPHFVAAIRVRAANAAGPLNIILCENLKNAGAIVRDQVESQLDGAALDYCRDQVGFVDTVIGRMVPPPRPEDRAENPGRIRVEPYKELPVDRRGFRGPVPRIVNMVPADRFEQYTARKLYIHNCGHALLAYAGYLAGCEYGYEAIEQPLIRSLLYAGWRESAPGIVRQTGADRAWLDEHMADLDRRFRNRALGDTVFRLGRDPLRKLGPTDRLVASARLAQAAGIFPVAIATGIAMAFAFDPADDPIATDLQQRLAGDGLAATMAAVTGIQPGERLGQFILGTHEQLRRQPA